MECGYILKECDIACLVVEFDMIVNFSLVPAHRIKVDLNLVLNPSCDFMSTRFWWWIVFFWTLLMCSKSMIEVICSWTWTLMLRFQLYGFMRLACSPRLPDWIHTLWIPLPEFELCKWIVVRDFEFSTICYWSVWTDLRYDLFLRAEQPARARVLAMGQMYPWLWDDTSPYP